MNATLAPAEPGTTAAPPMVANRFINGSAEHAEPFYDSGQVLTYGQEVSNVEVAANGFLSGILVRVDVVSSGNSASVAVRQDSPFNALSLVRLADINGANLFGPMDGWDWSQAVKYGGYRYENRPELNPAGYTNLSTGSGATAGSGSFILRIPVSVNQRDAFGSLPNMNAASALKLYFAVNSAANIFSTAPNGTVTFRIRASIETWLVPGATDANGVPNTLTPPALGAYQRWLKNTFTINSGANTIRMPNVSNYLRTLVFVFRSAAYTRNDSNFPSTLLLNLDGYARDSLRSYELRTRMFEEYGYAEAVAAAGSGIQTGVYVWNWSHELDGKPGFETRELYVPTNSATRLELVGDFGASGTLDVLWNDIVVPQGVGDYRAS
jgi:hypothetical protein